MQFLLENRLNRCQLLDGLVFKNRIQTKCRFSAHHYQPIGSTEHRQRNPSLSCRGGLQHVESMGRYL